MKLQCLTCAVSLFAGPVAAAYNYSSAALNQTSHNLIADPAGQIIYYNGTGNTPSYQQTSPAPPPITPLNSTTDLYNAFYTEITGIVNGSTFSGDNCTKCIASAEALHFAALTQPVSAFTELLIKMYSCEAQPAVQKTISSVNCRSFFSSTTNTTYPYSNGAAGLGPYYAQLFSKMSMATGDMQQYCYNVWSVCKAPAVIGINEASYFSSKPQSANTRPALSGKSINVLHLSDYHLDPRYEIGSEANCTSHLCCRADAVNSKLYTNAYNASVPASRFGAYACDSPPDLALSAFASMPKFFNMSSLAFTIFTGDIVSHDANDQLSQAYVEYEEEVSYNTFKAALGDSPLYATLGNHDSFPQALNTQNSLASTNAFGWNYNLLSSLWSNASWINSTEASYASTHYAAFAHTDASGVRIISLNTDFWYKANIFNYWNTTNPDTSGILHFLIKELTACEARGQRAWIIGHVLSGYDGTNPLPNPTALFYSIVVRFSPGTIAGIFFGHTHRQQYQVFYDFLPNSTYTINGVTYRNTSMVDYSKPLMTAFIGPSIVPLTNYNSGYTLYQVDSGTFEVTGMQTYFANISNSLSWQTPVWEFEYDTRKAYVPYLSGVGGWDQRAPLNATFWDKFAGVLAGNTQLAQLYSLYVTKSSILTPPCNSKACAVSTACYLKSGSAELGRACPVSSSSE